MGNSLSSKTENNNMTGGEKKLDDALDYIATFYILTMDFQSLRRLYEKEYCDELIILTSEIVNRYFSDIEIARLANRIESSSVDQPPADLGASVPGVDKVLFLKRDDIQHLNELDPERKKELCNLIAKFYVKIAHLFSAILTTINPEYVYSDSSGKKIRKKLSEKSTIPRDAVIEKINANLCDSRVDALKGEGNINTESPINEDDEITVKPKICSVDIYAKKTERMDSEGSLNDVPGIPELMDLYYDSDYDYETGNFKGMTEKTQQRFNEDLLRFYRVFTDSEEMPQDVKKFSDIKLVDYSKSKMCEERPSIFERESKGTYKNKLFADYANNLRQMVASVNEKQQQLLETINKLFVYVKDPREPEKEVIRVNPELTDQLLQELVAETRTAIVELYLKCETDFGEGVKLYQAIVESQILETAQSQISTLQSEAEKLYNPYSVKPPPVQVPTPVLNQEPPPPPTELKEVGK